MVWILSYTRKNKVLLGKAYVSLTVFLYKMFNILTHANEFWLRKSYKLQYFFQSPILLQSRIYICLFETKGFNWFFNLEITFLFTSP